MLHVVAVTAALVAATPFESSIQPLPAQTKSELKARGFWHQGCPVALGDLRMLTVSHYGFKGKHRTGTLIVNRTAAKPLQRAFRKLYALHFPIRSMEYDDFYGPVKERRKDGDVTASFECRKAAASPCTGRDRTPNWSNHAYGLAIDVNPLENPYVGCGQSRDPATRPFFDRSRHRPGMTTAASVRAFRAVGWGWGGAWTGNTKDYMHFSHNGH